MYFRFISEKMKESITVDAIAKKVLEAYENILIGSTEFTKRYTDSMGNYLYDVDRLIIQYSTPKGDRIDVWELESGFPEDELGFSEKETYTIEDFKNGRWTYRYKPVESS